MSNFLQKGFPTDRWAIIDPASLIANCVASLDAAIRTVFQITGSDGTTPKTTDFTTGTYPVNLQENLFRVLHDFQIGSGETVADIVDTIPVIPGLNEDRQLATVDAIRVFLSGVAASWGDDIYIPVITTPVAGNLPLMDADGELATSAYSPASFTAAGTAIPKIAAPVNNNFPLMQADGTLKTSAVAIASFMEAVPGAVPTNLPIFVDENTLQDSGVDLVDLAREASFGAIGCAVFNEAAAGNTYVAQPMDITNWTQGKGSALFSLSGGKVVCHEPGMYAISMFVSTTAPELSMRVNADTEYTYHREVPCTGDSVITATFTTLMYVGDEGEIEFAVRHPQGSVVPSSVSATVAKIGTDGVKA